MTPWFFYYFQGNTPPPPAPRRGLRDIARRDRNRAMASLMGVAEDIVYLPAVGSPVNGRGVWERWPRSKDTRDTSGIGVEATTNTELLDISIDLAPNLTRADCFQRVATGETWEIDYLEPLPGFGWHMILTKRVDAMARDAVTKVLR